MSQPRYVSFDDYYKDIVRHTVKECVLCGECVRGCMTYPITSLKDESPEYIMEKMIDFLTDGEFSEEVYLKAFSCTGCGDCSDLCPQEIDPMLTHEAIKIELVKQGKIAAYEVIGREVVLYWRVLKAEERVELGTVKWTRDHDAALALSAKSGKPVFLLFQEVPG